MSSAATPHGLHFVAESPVAGLAVAERRVVRPEATVICVHGGLDRGGSFARLARRTDRFDLVTYDRRGYQGSRELAPLGIANHERDLIALARHEVEGRPIIFFGHSFGGDVAYGAAIAEPSVACLVVTYEAPLPWILRRHGTGAPLGDDPDLEAERFFRRVVSDGAWERLSERERDSRRRDGPALVDDLAGVHTRTSPFRHHDVEGAGRLRVRRRPRADLLPNPERRAGGHESTHPKPTGDERRARRAPLGPRPTGRADRRTLGRDVRVGVTGSSGFIGSALVTALHERGDDVVRFVRPASSRGGEEIRWDPSRGLVDEGDLRRVGRFDAVVNLAGAGIADRRWSTSRKEEIRTSRTASTALLVELLASFGTAFLASGSAVGVYGSRDDEVLDESSATGDDFLAQVCTQWEVATSPLTSSGTAVAHLRSGLVMSSRGGSLQKQLPLFRFGLGGPFGTGRQWISPISLCDEVRAIVWLLQRRPSGPFNLVAPAALTNRDFTDALARQLHRPARLRVPSSVLRIALGAELVTGAVLASQRVVPTALREAGFTFEHSDIEAILSSALA